MLFERPPILLFWITLLLLLSQLLTNLLKSILDSHFQLTEQLYVLFDDEFAPFEARCLLLKWDFNMQQQTIRSLISLKKMSFFTIIYQKIIGCH